MKIVQNKLVSDDGAPIPYVQTPNQGGQMTPEYLVIHFTAGRDAQSSIDWFKNPQSKASAHLVIGRDGAITQMAAFNRVTWHAGVSQWMGRSGLNQFSIGIEIDNAGKLRREGGVWRAWFGAAIPDSEVLEATHKNETQPAGWHTYTEPQIQAVLDVSTLLVRQYGLKDVLGHEDIAPGRKSDPGPAFPLESLRSRAMGREVSEPPVFVTTASVNIRSGPGTEFKAIPGSPLATGAPVRLLKTDGVWFQVDVLETNRRVSDMVGWVHSRFLKPA